MANVHTTREPVVFRTWRRGGGVLALFPAWPTDLDGRHCAAYEHIGQHGGADYAHCIRQSRPARAAEYRELARELRAKGLRLIVCKRRTRAMIVEYSEIVRGWRESGRRDTQFPQ